MGLASDEPPHLPFRSAHPGRVELWQPLPVGKALATEGDGEESGRGRRGRGRRSARRPRMTPRACGCRARLPTRFSDWIEHGKDGRSVAPGDILILVRRRRDLAARIVARLQSLGVPVAGVDRFALTQPLGVQDLLSAMRFAIQPLDDLNLAALLVSPLIGWSQDDLFGFAHRRGKRALWEQLRAREAEVPAATMTALRGLLGMADFTTPYRFLDRMPGGADAGAAAALCAAGARGARSDRRTAGSGAELRAPAHTVVARFPERGRGRAVPISSGRPRRAATSCA